MAHWDQLNPGNNKSQDTRTRDLHPRSEGKQQVSHDYDQRDYDYVLCDDSVSNKNASCITNILDTIFRRINASGAEAENESSSLPDLKEICSVDPSIRQL